MALLSRNPSDRPSMLEFYQACTSVFTTSTTYDNVKSTVETLRDADGRGVGTVSYNGSYFGATPGQTVTETILMREAS